MNTAPQQLTLQKISNSNFTLCLSDYYQLTPKFYLKLHFTSIFLLFLIDFAYSLPSQSNNKAWASNQIQKISKSNTLLDELQIY